jgi:hypothetical protein
MSWGYANLLRLNMCFKELSQEHEAEAVVLRERSPIGLKLTFLGRFSVLGPFSPMLQRRAMGGDMSPP